MFTILYITNFPNKTFVLGTKLYRVNSLTPDKLKDIFNAASRGGIRKPKRNYLSRTNLSRNHLSRGDLSRKDLASRNNLDQVTEEDTIDL